MGIFGSGKDEQIVVDVQETGDVVAVTDGDYGHITDNADQLQRRLGNRQVQLIAIGGSIGTALFVSIGGALNKGGPASLFLAYTFYSCLLGLVNNCMAEMSTLHPVSGGFVRMAGKWVDDAFGFMAGWNFFLYEALLIPFEITALNLVLKFWRDDIPAAAVCAAVIVCYGLINLLAVRAYGEAEFWLSGGKFFLIVILFLFTFITMVGGNPEHNAYGFSNWGSRPFAEYLTTGDSGRWQGFLACLWSASFTIVGPEYISMVAAEVKRPRTYVKTAFKTVYWRFGIFFIMGALCVGIVVKHNDPTLVAILNGTEKGNGSGAAASPYVIAMRNLAIPVLPQIVNALLVTSIFSAGNTYTYAATRSLYGLALSGQAPKILTYCTKKGVPIVCFGVTMCFPLLSFLSVSNGANVVLTWLISLITAGGLIDYIVMCVTYIFFYRACKAQGVDRTLFPYVGRFQPYSAYIGLAGISTVLVFFGYTSFEPPSVSTFFQYYTMAIVAPILYIVWKLVHRTRFVSALECDLTWERPIVDAYEASFTSPPLGFWTELAQMVGFRRKAKDNVRNFSVVEANFAPPPEKV